MPDIFVSDLKGSGSREDVRVKEKIGITGRNSEGATQTKREPSGSPLSGFCYYPNGVDFVNREDKEKIILLLRSHPIVNLRWILLGLVMSVAPVFFLFFPFFEKLPSSYQNVLIIIWYMITFAFVFEEFLMWFFHVNIVTDERIIEVDFVSIFAREITDANIDQIQDVTSQIIGGLWTFFNYGNVIIQTASEVPRITFEKVPRPDEVAKILRELRVEEEVEKLEGRVR